MDYVTDGSSISLITSLMVLYIDMNYVPVDDSRYNGVDYWWLIGYFLKEHFLMYSCDINRYSRVNWNRQKKNGLVVCRCIKICHKIRIENE